MARKLTAQITIKADTRSADTSLKKLGTTSDKAFNQIESGGKRATSGVAGLTSGFTALAAKGLAAVAAFSAVIRAFSSTIAAANVQEQAITKLDAALSSLGPTADAVSEALQNQAAELQKVTKFGDEETIQAQALIAAFVKEEDQIKALTVRTLDFAEAKGVSLASAADLITKTFASSTNALTRYGIEVEGAAGSSERLKSITEGLDAAFAGAASAGADKFAFKIAQLENSFGDLQERVGEDVTSSGTVLASLDLLRKTLDSLGRDTAEVNESQSAFNIIQKATAAILTGNQAEVVKLSKALSGNRSIVDTLGGVYDSVVDVIKDAAVSFGLLEGKTEDVTDALGKQTEALLITQKQLDALVERDKRVIAATAELDEQLQALGFTTRTELVEAVDLAAVALDRARQGLRANLLTIKDVTKAERELAAAQRALRGESEADIVVTDKLADSTSLLSDEIESARARYERLIGVKRLDREETERGTAAINENIAAAENLAGGVSEFAQISGGTFTVTPAVFTGSNGRVRLARTFGPSGKATSRSG